jgi:hypothetical protein
MESKLKPHELYLAQMVEAKRRFRATARILGAKKPLTGDADVDNECAFLQVRRIIELITYSAIVSDEQRYRRSREIDAAENAKDRGDYKQDWNAAEILVRLARISPHFLPRPLGPMTVQPDGTKHFESATAKLTHDRLIALYKTAGGYAHTSNPYKEGRDELDEKKRSTARLTLEKEVAWLRSVIWEHVKIGLTWKPGDNPTELANSETAWLVWFGSADDDIIKMSLAAAV